MQHILLQHVPHVPVCRQQMELVERKGVGHPDSMCDAIMEAISVALCQAYVEATGQVLHHNLDKGLLVAGQTTPALGGGTVEVPMRLVIGDRATTRWHAHRSSQIGAPIDTPWIASAQVILVPGASLEDVERPMQDIMRAELADMHAFTARLRHGELPVW